MPELPEVQTTVSGLKESVVGLKIRDVWTSYGSRFHSGKDNIKDPEYFKYFKKMVAGRGNDASGNGRKIIGASRRAKNILIHLDRNLTILIHMKMTGHIMHGRYHFIKDRKQNKKRAEKTGVWTPADPHGPLSDPFNRHIRLVFILSDGTHLVMSDMRRFAKVTLVDTDTAHTSTHLHGIGPEPLDRAFTFEKFTERVATRPTGRIKQVIMDQSIVAGIGNIYADESLWRAGIHPEERVRSVPRSALKKLYTAIRSTLKKGIDFGGDSMSDYRNVKGERGKFQEHHRAYRKTGTKCSKPGCGGTIVRKKIGGRSSHFCDRHQKLSAK